MWKWLTSNTQSRAALIVILIMSGVINGLIGKHRPVKSGIVIHKHETVDTIFLIDTIGFEILWHSDSIYDSSKYELHPKFDITKLYETGHGIK